MLPATHYRIRAALSADGEFHIALTTLMALNNEEVSILLAAEQGFSPQSSKNEYFLHKGTIREEYDRAWRAAEKQGAFDMLFFNERGELTEEDDQVFASRSMVVGGPLQSHLDCSQA
jgi:para-aminobenzoate synthetase/4-amino-4-deoxychorismate lyase